MTVDEKVEGDREQIACWRSIYPEAIGSENTGRVLLSYRAAMAR